MLQLVKLVESGGVLLDVPLGQITNETQGNRGINSQIGTCILPSTVKAHSMKFLATRIPEFYLLYGTKSLRNKRRNQKILSLMGFSIGRKVKIPLEY